MSRSRYQATGINNRERQTNTNGVQKRSKYIKKENDECFIIASPTKDGTYWFKKGYNKRENGIYVHPTLKDALKFADETYFHLYRCKVPDNVTLTTRLRTFIVLEITNVFEDQRLSLMIVKMCPDKFKLVKNPTSTLCRAAVTSLASNIKYVPKDISNRRDIERIALKSYPMAIEHVIKQLENMCIDVIRRDHRAFVHVRNKTPKMWRIYINKIKTFTPDMMEEMKDSISTYLGKDRSSPEVTKEINSILLWAVEHFPEIIRSVKDPTFDMQMVAVDKDPYSISDIRDPHEDVIMAAIEKTVDVFYMFDNLSDRVIIHAIDLYPEVYKFLDDPSIDVTIAYCAKTGEYNTDITEEHHLQMVERDPRSALKISDRYPWVDKICLEACKRDRSIFESLSSIKRNRIRKELVSYYAAKDIPVAEYIKDEDASDVVVATSVVLTDAELAGSTNVPTTQTRTRNRTRQNRQTEELAMRNPVLQRTVCSIQ